MVPGPAYTQLPDPEPVPRSHWHLVPLVLGLGLGGHASTQALSAAEPALYEWGMSPMVFSVIAISPHVASILMPTLWGDCFVRSSSLALVLAPALLLAGQLLICSALLEHAEFKWHGSNVLRFGLLAVGFGLFSASRAGLAVVQFSALARLLRTSSLVGALCLVVITTHSIGASVQLLSPPLISLGGLLALQTALLVPAGLGTLSGLALACSLPPPPLDPPAPPSPASPPKQQGAFAVRCTVCGKAVRHQFPFTVECDECQRVARARWRARLAVLLLACWRALTLGPLHSFASLTNGFLVSHRLSARAAGALVAFNGSASLLVLIPLALASAAAGPRAAHATLRMLAASTLLAVVCVAALALLHQGRDASWAEAPPGESQTFAWWTARVSLLGIAACSAAAPVLLHALVPLVAPAAVVARAYGVLESFYFVGLAGASLSMGAARQWAGGFHGVLYLLLVMLLSSFFAIRILRRVVLSQEAAAARAAVAQAEVSPAEPSPAEPYRMRGWRGHARPGEGFDRPRRGEAPPCEDEEVGCGRCASGRRRSPTTPGGGSSP
jgi:hypothetical protein